jgi:hypothetical protein
MATEGRWREAIDINKEIIERSPRDVEAFNRLGKSYFELRQYRSAYEAYQTAFQLDPANVIAIRNLSRIEPLKETEEETGETIGRIRNLKAGVFVEEVGRTYVDDLVNVGTASIMTELSSGDQLTMQVQDDDVLLFDEDEQYIGQFEPRLAKRVIELMSLGNEYAVFVTANTGQSVRVIIRETHKGPAMGGRLSFPNQGKISVPRAYIRDTRLFRAEPDMLLGEDDDEDLDVDDAEEFDVADSDEDDTTYVEESGAPVDEDEEEPI